jgi:putative flippase GtrA
MSTSIHIGVASAYLHFIKNSVLISNICGFLVAYVFSYFMQSKHVFQQSISTKKAFKYFFVQFGTLVLAVFASKHVIFYDTYFQTVVVALVLVFVSFGVNAFWTFNKKEHMS